MAKLSPVEQAEFRAAVADVLPLQSDRVHFEPPAPLAIPRQHRRDEAAALGESLHGAMLLDLYLEGGDEAAWLRNGMARQVLRDLRRGRWVMQGKLDLHGLNRDEARVAVVEFLNEPKNRI
jgi:DNA-nicking Smr family endonuclease